MTELTDIAKLSARRKVTPSGLELAARIREGSSAGDLAAEFEVSKSKISRAVNDAGFSSGDGRSTVQLRPEQARVPIVSYGWLGYTEELDGAACFQHPYLSPDAWFPSTQGERRATGAEATTACNSCPVRVTCLTRALDEERDGIRHGIRGGLSEDERADLAEGGAA